MLKQVNGCDTVTLNMDRDNFDQPDEKENDESEDIGVIIEYKF